MHFNSRHAVFCDPPLIPEDAVSLHLPNSTRGSEVRLSYRTTPLEMSETPCLAQRHLNMADTITLYATGQPLLIILMMNSLHTIDY